MDSKFIPSDHEKKIYDFWEKKGYFEAKIDPKKKPFTIILPPPNANADLHLGHAMYTYEDIMIRFKKLRGYSTFWLSGADHAGFETQFVFEKHLKKQDKSRFDYDRETLYKMIWDFVIKNRGTMETQLRALGFSLDWSKTLFTLDEKIVSTVYKTFKKLHDDGLIYRSKRLVNYCTFDGTSFSDLEVLDKEVEVERGLFHLEYSIKGGGSITVATTRPETMFGDVALMVHPKDKRYSSLIGKIALIPVINKEIPIITDEYVDMDFGTGAVKVTPAHDFNDFEIGKKHNLPSIQVIGFDGKLYGTGTKYDGMRVAPARALLEEDLKLEAKKHTLVLKTCYKCGKTLEPLPLAQWYVKVKPLADNALEALKKKETVIVPKKFEKHALNWLTNFHDWNISRQIVWGIRIPAWKCEDCSEWTVTDGQAPSSCIHCKKSNLVQDEDTFDTWFSSGQWPVATLKALGEDYFNYFYPTSVMETGYDILPWWVCRMMMLGIYMTGETPFNTIFLHGLIRDSKGAKMSKSRGNVVNPMIMIEKYGADALRAALIFGTGEGNDISFSEDKVRSMRNFANKIWNMGRFLMMTRHSGAQAIESQVDPIGHSVPSRMTIEDLEKEFQTLKKQVMKDMEAYRFSSALNSLYEFIWHRYADFYIEQLKVEAQSGNITLTKKLEEVYLDSLVLLHPFMPFVTEALWNVFNGEERSILEEQL
ncbi:valine--tRNA ligase [Candidatus Roizmanbacteria bacterium RIFCSPHIGHO2_02_FULL_40_13b]|uniref:Valine--tRNA ligase n=1 Tax=Candidatus Roizmanbacteria bacterium RIFCSPHIGHO2_01_FULL_39_24 TaxID=1802032 RepID=A0A1F7GKJ2_9BACT|nr:MAG: valine--tRNA ligase [Candidatus Roizmanbacteria bacterium RIFCSPHIGHO2_01_FULL_39_24]OGK27423.1 MAG: valine--tRNA ligase [Candidatus Roizmanbacteria bacterium RIFCSPHIGHO2_02_FULL_40_13b]OGK50432.1 MAG: valine--tRNA ligase [Candidatus Roizmanbacteria bacterium RIFCSPLOWO2_01_FULL_40_32]OGK56389.1 MAG: valine--tRNA ligase [Candidatus Roizmanbacteria bacterium RIFCSPLOWO2_02_FULL_39_8]